MLDNSGETPRSLRSFVPGALPRIAAADVATFGTLAKKPPEGTADLAGRSLRYRWRQDAQLPPERCVDICAQVGERTLVARIERGLLEALLLEDVDFALIDERLYALLAEHLLSRWIERIEIDLDARARLSVDFAPADRPLSPLGLDVFVEEEEAPFAVAVYGDWPPFEPFIASAPGAVAQPSFDTLPVRIAVRSRPLLVPRRDVSALVAGDVLYLEDRGFLIHSFRLDAAGTDCGPVVIDKDTVVLSRQGPDNAAKGRAPAMAENAAKLDTDALNVEISVEVGQATVPLSKLKELAPGAVIDLGSLSPQDVRLRAEGQIFAHAQMVEVGDGIGLRITKVV